MQCFSTTIFDKQSIEGTHKHTTLPEPDEHSMCIHHTFQLDSDPRIKAERRAIPIVIPLRTRTRQSGRPETVVHKRQLLIAHLASIVPLGLIDELDGLVCVHFVDVFGCGADVRMPKLEGMSTVPWKVGWDPDGNRFTSGEVQHPSGQGAQWTRPFEVATVVVDIFDHFVGFVT